MKPSAKIQEAIAARKEAEAACDAARRRAGAAYLALFDALAAEVPASLGPGSDVELDYGVSYRRGRDGRIVKRVRVIRYEPCAGDIVLVGREYLKDGELGVEKAFPWHRLPKEVGEWFRPLRRY